MDKTREYLAILRKHHFWVICGVVLLASMTSWFLAESRLDKEFKEQVTLVDGKFAAMNGIATTVDHPNDKVTEKMREQVVGIGDNVFDAWQLRYEEQRKVPQWQGELSDPFLDFVRRKEPDVTIPKPYCEEYMYFIRKEIDTLFTQVNARDLVVIEDPTILPNQPGPKTPSPIRQNRTTRPTRTQVRPGAVDRNLGVTEEWKGIVFWDEAQREALRTQYYWASRPTSQQVRYANEDLWIYRALLDIIKKTNGDVKEHLLASVKKIDGLYIGPMVQPPAQFYVPPISTAAAEGEAGADGGDGSVAATDMAADGGAGLMAPPAPGGMPGGGGEAGDGAAVGATLSQEEYVNATLRHLRYVDAKGRPLGYNSPEPFAEFKIMPFEMRLVMDQRRLPELLANAANSPLPVEVRQVSIVSTETMPAGLGGDPSGRSSMPSMAMQGSFGRGGRMPGGDDDGGMGGMMMGRGARMPTRSSYGEGGMSPTDLGGSVELRPWDLNVEVRGVIYIFNKPNRENVGKAVAAPEPAAAPAEAGAGV